MSVTLRMAVADDLRFVRSCWLASAAWSDWAKLMTPRETWVARTAKRKPPASDEWFAGQRALIDRLVASANVTVAEADDGLLAGFIVRDWSEPVVHYVYVRRMDRATGVARLLVADLADKPARFTHLREGVDRKRLPPSWRLDFFPLTEVE